MKQELFSQCKLVKTEPGRELTQVSWIPASLAIMGQMLRLREENDNWSEGWRVASVGATQPKASLTAIHQTHESFSKVLNPHR